MATDERIRKLLAIIALLSSTSEQASSSASGLVNGVRELIKGLEELRDTVDSTLSSLSAASSGFANRLNTIWTGFERVSSIITQVTSVTTKLYEATQATIQAQVSWQNAMAGFPIQLLQLYRAQVQSIYALNLLTQAQAIYNLALESQNPEEIAAAQKQLNLQQAQYQVTLLDVTRAQLQYNARYISLANDVAVATQKDVQVFGALLDAALKLAETIYSMLIPSMIAARLTAAGTAASTMFSAGAGLAGGAALGGAARAAAGAATAEAATVAEEAGLMAGLRVAGGLALRIGLRAIPYIGLALTAYDIYDFFANTEMGRSILNQMAGGIRGGLETMSNVFNINVSKEVDMKKVQDAINESLSSTARRMTTTRGVYG